MKATRGAVRCSFVDYDGAAALERWHQAPPDSPEEEAAFVRANCPLVTDGVAVIDRYLGQVRRGERPRHYGGLEVVVPAEADIGLVVEGKLAQCRTAGADLDRKTKATGAATGRQEKSQLCGGHRVPAELLERL